MPTFLALLLDKLEYYGEIIAKAKSKGKGAGPPMCLVFAFFAPYRAVLPKFFS